MDRNPIDVMAVSALPESLSARRAWIEILSRSMLSVRLLVALRKESVDRNACNFSALSLPFGSLSARRAWIEITSDVSERESLAESLSARRAWIEMSVMVSRNLATLSLSARRAWIEIPQR